MEAPTNLWTRDSDGWVKIHCHAGQRAALDSRRRFVFIQAGRQWGKTVFGPWWLAAEIQRCGPGDYLAATSSHELFKLKMLPELISVFCDVLKRGRYWAGDRLIELADPSGRYLAKTSWGSMWGRIILRSAAAGAQTFEAATAKAAWIDEYGQDDFTLEHWEALQGRLSVHQGRCLGTSTLYNLGWSKTEIHDRWKAGDPNIDVIQSPSYINPSFPRAEYDRMKAHMQAWRFAMMYDGAFSRPAGMIYNSFRDAPWPQGHLLDVGDPPADWPRVVGVDFGGANLGRVFLAYDQARALWVVYDEDMSGERTTQDAVDDTLRRVADCRDMVAVGGAPGESQCRRDWGAAGMAVEEPPVDGVEPQIDRVAGMFTRGRLAVSPRCRHLLDELGSYRRKLDGDGNPTEEILEKRRFHLLDATRYACSIIAEQGDGKLLAFSI